jgi:hypothetical protein
LLSQKDPTEHRPNDNQDPGSYLPELQTGELAAFDKFLPEIAQVRDRTAERG